MVNLVEARGYLGSVVNRAVGRSAWTEAMRQPSLRNLDYLEIPAWAQTINNWFDHGAPVAAGFEAFAPTTSRFFRWMSTALDHPESSIITRYPALLIPSGMIASAAIDTILFTLIASSSHNAGELIGLKLSANAATHLGIDLVSVAINRVRHLKPPNISTLAV